MLVVSEAGVPVEAAAVHRRREGDARYGLMGRTDAFGRLGIPVVAEAGTEFLAVHPSFPPARRTVSAQVAELELVMPPGSRVSGRLTIGGEALAEAGIRVLVLEESMELPGPERLLDPDDVEL